jgi:hypothetical protein
MRETSRLSRRILDYLVQAEDAETDPWLRDDYRIAWITVRRAARRESIPHVSASYAVLGLHPDKVWPAIVERRKAIFGEQPKKPVQSERDPRWKKRAA